MPRPVRPGTGRCRSCTWPPRISTSIAWRARRTSTAKAALNNLTKALAEEFGAQGLRALTVSPCPTRTRNWSAPDGYAADVAAQRGTTLAEFLDQVPTRMGITTGRLTDPGETAALVTFLASERSGNLTGADYLADGGVIKTV